MRVAIRDPGFAGLRRASRAAIVVPLAMAFTMFVLKDANALLFVVFGCFAMLVMSDFGGLRPARALAYVTATAAGAVLIVIGTLASGNPWLASAVMFLVAFVMNFARVFGGYAAAGEVGLLLSFVISLSIPAPVNAIPGRLTGWILAGVLSTVSSILLWPRFERVTVRKAAARACLALAEAVDALGSRSSPEELSKRIQGARRTQQITAEQFRAIVNRPVGPARRDRAFVELLSELDRMVDILEHPFHRETPSPVLDLPESHQLALAVAEVLRSSGDVLVGSSPPDLAALDKARNEHRDALDRWGSRQLRAGRPVDEVLDGIDADHTLRTISYLAIALGSNASLTAGVEPRGIRLPSAAPARSGVAGAATRVVRTVRTHLNPTSTVLQGSVRVAVGLAIAVWLARALGLSHAFWVVLGALQVLRSNALGTGRTTIQALVGNAFGVVVGGLFALAAGNHAIVMWAALPIAIFVAAYAASAVGFMASQAAFTINLIVIFNLLAPSGWQIGLVRLEDLAVGVGISLVVGVLLWPRGARREFARSLAGLYRAMTPQLRQGFNDILGVDGGASGSVNLRRAFSARDRAGEALEALMNEHSASSLDAQTAGQLVAAGNHVLLAAELLGVVARRMHYQAKACQDSATEVATQADSVIKEFDQLADQLSLSSSLERDGGRPSLERIRGAELDCLRRWRNDDGAGRGAIALVIAGEWVNNLDRLEDTLRRPVAIAADAARTPWWR